MSDESKHVHMRRTMREKCKQVLAVFMIAAAQFAGSALAVGPGLVARYSFDETAGPTRNDSAGYNTYAKETGSGFIYDGAPIPAGTYGSLKVVGDAWGPTGGLSAGTGSWTTEGSGELGTLVNDFTVMAWVKPDDIAFRERIIGRPDSGSGGWSFGIDGTGKLVLTGYGIADVVSTATGVQAGQWQHVAVTKSSTGGVTFYLNGNVFDTDSTQTADWTASTDPWELLGDTGQNLVGLVDDVRVYRGVLDIDQISAAALPPPRLLANYTFDEAAGPLRLDSAGFNSNARESGSGFTYLGSPIPAGTYGTSVSIAGTTFGATGGISSGAAGEWVTSGNNETGPLVNDFTAMAWVNPQPSAAVPLHRVINNTIYGGTTPTGWGFGIDGNSGGTLVLTGYGIADVRSTATKLTVNQWQHVAVTKSGSSGVRFYFNGDLLPDDSSDNNASHTEDWLPSTAPFSLMGGPDEPLTGSVDEVKVYQGVLSQQQIRDAASGLHCSTADLALLDDGELGQSPGSVSDDLTIADDDLISDLNVTLSVSHSFVGDLQVLLEHIDTGTQVELVHRPVDGIGDCSGGNIQATFDDSAGSLADAGCVNSTPAISGTVRPTAMLSAFQNERLAGTWRLHINDGAAGNSGTLNYWCLQIQKSTFPDTIFAHGFEL